MKLTEKLSMGFSEIVLPYLRAREKKPLAVQLRECLALYRAYRFFPYQYFRSGLYVDFDCGRIEDYLPPVFVQAYRATLNGKDSIAVDDKVTFARRAEEAGLPVPRTLFLIETNGDLTDLYGAPLSEEAAGALIDDRGGRAFAKPRTGAHGEGALFMDRAELAVQRRANTAYIVQAVARQHPEMAAVNPDTLNTVRIDTLLLDGAVTNSGAFARFGRKGEVTDNAYGGRFIVAVDLETGVLRGPARQKLGFSTRVFPAHADTGVPFDGRQVPYWDDLRACVANAAQVFRPLRSIGWDVGITPDGPVIIEGNANWEVAINQMTHGVGASRLGREAVRHWAGGSPDRDAEGGAAGATPAPGA